MNLITVSRRGRVEDLPNQPPKDLITALYDIWPEFTTQFVKVIYRNLDFPANQANSALGWKGHHIWPKSQGWTTYPALTDVYSKAPADSTVLDRKLNFWFGECGKVKEANKCFSPATFRIISRGSKSPRHVFLHSPI